MLALHNTLLQGVRIMSGFLTDEFYSLKLPLSLQELFTEELRY